MRVLLTGHVFADFHNVEDKVRLGGIFHAARALHAAQIPYAMAYVSPNYLDNAIRKFAASLDCVHCMRMGEVHDAPSLIFVGDSKEAQGNSYREVLRDAKSITLQPKVLRELVETFCPTDVLFIGDDPPVELFSAPEQLRIHMDLQSLTPVFSGRTRIPRGRVSTLLVSSSSYSELPGVREAPLSLWHKASEFAETLILKENRGGARAISANARWSSPAFPTRTVHSVGVGDVFTAMFVTNGQDEYAMRAASLVASTYASTFSHSEFVDDARIALKSRAAESLRGALLPWESRQEKSIYLAAPDFPNVDTRLLDELERALAYHNFKPRRPIREHGLGLPTMSRTERRNLFRKDVELLADCTALVATPIIDDPGTFVELGWFSAASKPTILLDPEKRVQNLFAENAATAVARNVPEVIDLIFALCGSEPT